MAKDTNKNLRNLVIYEVYPRAYSKNGSLNEITKDIKRIKNLGFDVLWLMPIHPIGEIGRKGSLGCPYSIKDYTKIESGLGDEDDFKKLINEAHKNDMMIFMDIVFNHTSRDSNYLMENPDYFYKNENGQFGNKVGDWTDIYDLDYENSELSERQIKVLKYWANFGVDGFRCDVASLVPLSFWMKARDEIKKINSNFIWLAESVEPSFILELRKRGFAALSDSEVYNAFDITYDYDVFGFLMDYINGKIKLKDYIEKLKQQEYIYPENYVKLRFLENHDRERAAKIIPDFDKLKMWTAFMFMERGAALIYNGEEALDKNVLSLFEKDLVDFSSYSEEYAKLIRKLSSIKKYRIMAYGNYHISIDEDSDVVIINYELDGKNQMCIFNFGEKEANISIDKEDGNYKDILNDEEINIINHRIQINKKPMILEV